MSGKISARQHSRFFFYTNKLNLEFDGNKASDAADSTEWRSIMKFKEDTPIYCNWSMKEEQCPGTRNTTQSAFGEFKNNIKVDILNLRVFLRTL